VQVADADAVLGPGWLAASPAPDRVLLDDDTPPAKNYVGAISSGSARIVAWHSTRIEIAVDSELGGVLALNETWYPGWIAEIDGKRVPILRADVLFRGLEVPAGRHREEFRFEPCYFYNLVDAWRLTQRGRR
jgi:hypothetical protein